MKTKEMIQRLSLFLLALVLTMPTWAQGNNGMEVVSIGSKAEWKAFCQRVNHNGEPFLNAKLTQDVDLGGEIVMLGSVSYPYSGTFDGNGHTLKFNWNAGEDNQIAPFYYVENATIRNLRTQGKITSKGYSLSGMVYAALGTTTITGCISDVDITGGDGGWNDSRAAGMVQAVADGASVTITDCLVKGSITDNADEDYRRMAGFVFSNNGTYTLTRCLYVGKNNATGDPNSKTFGETGGISTTFTDCYYLNPCGKAQGKQVTAERLKSGEMAKLLQGDRTENVWGQKLGTDLEPLPTTDATKRVYEVKFVYNGEVKATRYATNGQSIHGGLPTAQDLLGTGYNPHHYYAIAFADGFNASTTVNADRKVDITLAEKDCYEIASKADWKTFCDLVNSGQNAVDAKLTQDVDLGGDIAKVGTANKPYAGTFDGQNHTLTVNWDAGSVNDVAPFGRVNGATIKNLRTEGSIRSNSFYLSGLIDEAYGENTITGCVSNVNLTTSYANASCDAAGLICYISTDGRVTISDCLVKGSINATAEKGQKGMGGFVCYQYGTCTLNNCLYAGTNNASGGYTFASDFDPKATTTLNNCYYLNTCGEAQGTQVTKAQLKNGYVAHKLQGTREETVWGQVLGTDTIPQPTAEVAKQVYEVKFTYNGEVKATRYANRGGNVGTLPTPQEILGTAYNAANSYRLVFAEGFYAEYPIYADRTVAVDVIVNNMCEIATKEDWKKFGDFVRSGEGNLNARLTADIDLGGDILKIGSESTGYSGTFDGQGHTITVDWNGNGGGYFALFPFVTDATIKNLRVTGKMTTDVPMGVFSYLAGGTTTYEHCVSDVRITSGDENSSYSAAGMVRAAYNEGKITFKDCIVAGDLNGTTDNSKQNMGGFVCSQADDATCTFDNCLYTGTNNSKGGYAFAPNPTLNNCYYLNPCGEAQGTQVTAERLKSGYVAHKLQGTREETVWGQVLGTDTIPQPTADAAKRVRKVDFTYKNDVKATRYANDGKSIHGGMPTFTAKDLLGTGYNPHHYYAIAFEGGFNASTPVNADRKVDITLAEKDCYEIASKENWKEFCVLVNGGQTKLNAKMTADVDLGTDIAMVGTTNNLYGGTFDGQNHTLTVNWDAGSANDVAPFRRVSGATIKNLRTEGAIRSDSYYLGGLIDEAIGENTVTGCVSNVNLTTSYDYSSCDAAGLICYIYTTGRVTISDCLVKGSINATGKKGRRGMGGFVYVQNGTLVMNNCLYAGTNNASGGYTFASDSDDEATTTLNNCYYLNPCGKAQGERIVEKQLKSGEVTKKLQGDRTDKCYWAQQLGGMPDFYNAADKSKANYVYYDAAKKGWVCDDFRLTDGQPLPIGLDFTAATVTYERNFNGAQKATLCLPYDLYAQGFKAYTLSGGNKNEVH
uniref:filamentous hemagglutinin n=1 Tax=Segatella buccae TaxID=28126 RepID=UPI00248E7E48